MNTLSKTITGTVLGETAYEALRRHWAGLVRCKASGLGPEHYLLYLALLGRDWRRAFSPVTNPATLAKGGFFNWRFWPAIRALHARQAEERLLAPFAGLVSATQLEALRPLLPQPKYSQRDEDLRAFQAGRWPFDAYREPDQSQGLDSAHAG